MKWDDRIGRRLRLKDLHTLQTVAELGSMAKASQHLALSQPAISKAISDMERTLGAALLDRSSRGVELTACGQVLVERARIIFDEVRQGVANIKTLSDPTVGEVRIGTTEPLAAVVSEIINRLARKHPRISCFVMVGHNDVLVRELRERRIDVMLTRWIKPLIAEDLAAHVLFESAVAVMAQRRHPLLRYKSLRLADLMTERWTLAPTDSFPGRVVADLFARNRLVLPSAAVTTASIYLRLNLLASSRLLSVLPLELLRHASNRAWLRALSVDLGDSSAPIALISLKKRPCVGAVRLFQGVSIETCKGIGGKR
jgi:DNA-binding transcriptional LysR family regulator